MFIFRILLHRRIVVSSQLSLMTSFLDDSLDCLEYGSQVCLSCTSQMAHKVVAEARRKFEGLSANNFLTLRGKRYLLQSRHPPQATEL